MPSPFDRPRATLLYCCVPRCCVVLHLQEFRRTKNDCGDCPCIHDDNCRKQYEELDDRSKDRYG